MYDIYGAYKSYQLPTLKKVNMNKKERVLKNLKGYNPNGY